MKELRPLTPREITVLRLRFGIEDGRRWTLREIGMVLGIKAARVRQLEARAFRKVAAHLRPLIPDEHWLLKLFEQPKPQSPLRGGPVPPECEEINRLYGEPGWVRADIGAELRGKELTGITMKMAFPDGYAEVAISGRQADVMWRIANYLLRMEAGRED